MRGNPRGIRGPLVRLSVPSRRADELFGGAHGVAARLLGAVDRPVRGHDCSLDRVAVVRVDGQADAFFAYNFQQVATQRYQNAEGTLLNIEVWQLAQPDPST